jgi:hypothetical protein
MNIRFLKTDIRTVISDILFLFRISSSSNPSPQQPNVENLSGNGPANECGVRLRQALTFYVPVILIVYRDLLPESTFNPLAQRVKLTSTPDEDLYRIFHWLRKASTPPACAVDCYFRRMLGQPEAGSYEVICSGNKTFKQCCDDVFSQIPYLSYEAYKDAPKLKDALLLIARRPECLDSVEEILTKNNLWPLDMQQVHHRSPAIVADAQTNPSDAPAPAAEGIACGDAINDSAMNHQPQVGHPRGARRL